MTKTAEKPVSVVQDKGRRGNPLPGCDCVVCFGYCMIDGDERSRSITQAQSVARVRRADDDLAGAEESRNKYTG